MRSAESIQAFSPASGKQVKSNSHLRPPGTYLDSRTQFEDILQGELNRCEAVAPEITVTIQGAPD